MEKPWFQNRICLDIGCNEGVITLGLAMRFGTASMLGVDIDQALINKASRCGQFHSQAKEGMQESSSALILELPNLVEPGMRLEKRVSWSRYPLYVRPQHLSRAT